MHRINNMLFCVRYLVLIDTNDVDSAVNCMNRLVNIGLLTLFKSVRLAIKLCTGNKVLFAINLQHVLALVMFKVKIVTLVWESIECAFLGILDTHTLEDASTFLLASTPRRYNVRLSYMRLRLTSRLNGLTRMRLNG
jgi:hypothetical protein